MSPNERTRFIAIDHCHWLITLNPVHLVNISATIAQIFLGTYFYGAPCSLQFLQSLQKLLTFLYDIIARISIQINFLLPPTYSVSQKNPPKVIWIFSFFSQTSIFNRFSTHLLHVPMYARLQICIQLSPTLTKLCHIKRDYPVRIICAKCPKRAKTRAFRRLRKSLIALLIVVCGKSL